MPRHLSRGLRRVLRGDDKRVALEEPCAIATLTPPAAAPEHPRRHPWAAAYAVADDGDDWPRRARRDVIDQPARQLLPKRLAQGRDGAIRFTFGIVKPMEPRRGPEKRRLTAVSVDCRNVRAASQDADHALAGDGHDGLVATVASAFTG
jgi:hypothetical protein